MMDAVIPDEFKIVDDYMCNLNSTLLYSFKNLFTCKSIKKNQKNKWIWAQNHDAYEKKKK